jgi:ribosomal protein L37E
VGQYREFRDEVTIAASELARLRAYAERTASVHATRPERPVTCMTCGHESRVKACAACLVGEGARIERRYDGGIEQVRFAMHDGTGGTTYVSDWTPVLARDVTKE